MNAAAYSDTEDEVQDTIAAAAIQTNIPEPSPARKAQQQSKRESEMAYRPPTAALALAAGITVLGLVLTKLFTSRRKRPGDDSAPATKLPLLAVPHAISESKPKRSATRSG